MKGTGRFKDINKISAIVGIIVLVFLVVGLLTTIIVVSIHTNAYLEYQEGRIKDIKIESGATASCPTSALKKATNLADAVKIDVEIKDISVPNRDAEGKCIKIDLANASSKDDCPDTWTSRETVVTFSELRKDLELELTNNYNDETLNIKSDGKSLEIEKDDNSSNREYKVTKNSYSFLNGNPQTIVRYTLNVYYTNGGCDRVLARTVKFETPKFNYLSTLPLCEGKEKAERCQEYIYSDNPVSGDYNLSKVLKDIDEIDAKKIEEEEYNNNKIRLILVSVGVIILLIVSIVVAVIGTLKVRKGGALHENEIDENYDEDSSKTFDEYQKSIEEGKEDKETDKK